MKDLVREVGIGLVMAVLIILAVQGFNIIPLIFLGFLLFFGWQVFSRNGFDGMLTSGNVVSGDSIPEIKFDEIGGQESAKKELMEGLDFIRDVNRIRDMGIRPIKGVLLSGPPGTGKTLMARAAARYTKSIFKATSGSEFIEMYAGVGAKRIRDLFQEAGEEARKLEKDSAIIFIDEIDILGGKRGQVTSHLEYDQTLNQLLVEMDGLSVDDGVQILVMATTNRIDILDPALLRPGRFDRIINVDLPAKRGRLSILQIHTANKPLAPGVDLEAIARETFRFSGAHLENLCNEAAILALREQKKYIEQQHFLEAIDKVIMGEKLDRRPTQQELKRIAVHETGHALVGESLCPGSVSAITITSRGRALGYVRHNRQEDHYLETEEYLGQQVCIALAGAVAEEEILENRSTGAAGDFKQATELVQRMIKSGMSNLGVVKIESLPEEIMHREMTTILEQYETEVRSLIRDNRQLIIQIADKLVDSEKFSGDKLRQLLGD